MEKKIKTWQEAFKVKGLDPTKLPDVSMIPEEYQKPVIAQYKLNVVADVHSKHLLKKLLNEKF